MTRLLDASPAAVRYAQAMPILESVLAALQQEGYRPVRETEPGAAQQTAAFRYYGQPAVVRVRPLGAAAIAGLECALPRPARPAADAEVFAAQHPLARLSNQDGQARLHIESILSGTDTGGQFLALLHLLDTYAADVVFGDGQAPGAAVPAQAPTAEAVIAGPASTPLANAFTPPAALDSAAPARPADVPAQQNVGRPDAATSVAGTADAGPQDTRTQTQDAPPAAAGTPTWDATLAILNERFHPLARAMQALQLPVPDEVHMDMLQGRQVRGTAIMMWGSPPDAVVVCEPGQVLPRGYQGNTWLRHQTTGQVALETQTFLKAVGKA